MRELSVNEIAQLEERGCWAEDWSNILVDDDFGVSSVMNVQFYGHVEIGNLNDSIDVEDGFRRRCCIKNATLKDVTIGDGCLIENVRGFISDYAIGDGCYLSDIGIINSQEGAKYAEGHAIAVLNEGGDENVVMFSGLTAQLAWLMINYPCVRTMVKNELSGNESEKAKIGNGVRIVGVKEVTSAMIGDGCEVKGASRIANSTIISTDEASTFISSDAIIENTIVAAGASITDGAKVDNCFVGESVHIGKGFSAESSLFFANSYMDNGEACAAFCGPFSTSHHKSTLLIGGAFSFYNAGSGTNQSNHAYKMGPIHWGILGRGSKTASGSHILWPATVGTFSMVMGKIQNHPKLHKLPFSYVIANGNGTKVVPGINISTVGTWRDVLKWPKRDLRPLSARRDIINFDFPNPYIIQYVLEGKEILEKLLKKEGDVLEYNKCQISRRAAAKGLKYYELAISLFLYNYFSTNSSEEQGEPQNGTWLDLCGMLAPKAEIDRVVNDIESGAISTTDELLSILCGINAEYKNNVSQYAQFVMQHEGNSMFVDRDQWMKQAEEAHNQWLQMVKADAEKEYQMGDVEEEQLRNFLKSIG